MDPLLLFVVNEISRNKVVVLEGAAGLIIISQIISVSWVFIYAELLCRAIRHDLILLIILLFIFVVFVYWRIVVIAFLWFNFLYDRLFVPWGVVN